MGEIGFPRREFLYEIQFWEVRRIIRGYRRRDILTYQLLRLNAYMSCFAMRENKLNKSPQEWLPMDFDNDDDDDSTPGITDKAIDDLRSLMKSLNEKK